MPLVKRAFVKRQPQARLESPAGRGPGARGSIGYAGQFALQLLQMGPVLGFFAQLIGVVGNVESSSHGYKSKF